MIYESGKYKYDFENIPTRRSFGGSILMLKLQTKLLQTILEFNDKVRPRSKADKYKKKNTYESLNALYEDRELTLNAFKSVIFPFKSTQGK